MSVHSGVLDREELFETLNFLDVDNTVDGSGQGKQKSLPSVSVETEISRRIGDCNVRRSLAWDSAFFTNPGMSHCLDMKNTCCSLI